MIEKQKNFREWLKTQLECRGWSRRYFETKIGYTHSHITNVINGEKYASFEFCQKVAIALNEPVWKVFVMAGLVDPPGDIQIDEETSFIVDAYKQLSEKHQREIFEYVQWYTTRHSDDEDPE